MRPVVVQSPAGIGYSAPVPVDRNLNQNIGVAVTFNGAVATCNVQWSLDDPYASYPTSYNVNGNWLTDPTLQNMTANEASKIDMPVRAVRLQNTAWTSGQPTMTVVQAGGIA